MYGYALALNRPRPLLLGAGAGAASASCSSALEPALKRFLLPELARFGAGVASSRGCSESLFSWALAACPLPKKAFRTNP